MSFCLHLQGGPGHRQRLLDGGLLAVWSPPAAGPGSRGGARAGPGGGGGEGRGPLQLPPWQQQRASPPLCKCN